MKKVLLAVSVIVVLLLSGCGQGNYEGKTITYVDEYSPYGDISVWYEVPEGWDVLDKMGTSTFVPNAQDQIVVEYNSQKEAYDNISGIVEINESIIEHEELTLNGHKVLKYTASNDDGYEYYYFVDFENFGGIIIHTNKLQKSVNPYEKEMKRIAETIKKI